MTKLTEAHIRRAMSLKPDVRVMLGKLDDPGMPGIVIIGDAFYTYRQVGNFRRNVVLSLQFCQQPTGMLLYPSTVSFALWSTDDQNRIDRLQVAVSDLVTALKTEGSHDDAARVAAILTLPAEDLIRVHDALYIGMARDTFLKALARAEPARMFRVYFERGTDNGPMKLYACGPARPGSEETLWRQSSTSIHAHARAHAYDADGVEALRTANTTRVLHTEPVQ